MAPGFWRFCRVFAVPPHILTRYMVGLCGRRGNNCPPCLSALYPAVSDVIFVLSSKPCRHPKNVFSCCLFE